MIAGEAWWPRSWCSAGVRGAVGDQPGDGPGGGWKVLPPMRPTRQLLPALVLSQGMFDRDPIYRMRVAAMLPSFVKLGQSTPVRLTRRSDGLPRVVASQAEVAVVEQHLYLGEVARTGVDVLGARTAACVVHPPRPHHIGSQRVPALVSHDSGLQRVLLLLARDERPPTAPARLGNPDLDLGGVQPQFDCFGLGVSEDTLQGA